MVEVIGDVLNWIRKNFFTLQFASLGAFRFFFGLCLIFESILRIRDAAWSLLPDSVLTQSDALQLSAGNYYSILNYLPKIGCEVFLLIAPIVYLLFALEGSLGTRVLALFFFAETNMRNVQVLDGFHSIGTTFLLFSLALPLDRRFSVSSFLNQSRSIGAWLKHESRGGDFVSAASFLILFSIAEIYFFNWYAKAGLSWREGLGEYYPLFLAMNQTWIAIWTRTHIPLSFHRMLGHTVLFIEGSIPFLLFWPVLNSFMRRIAFVFQIALHFGIFLTISLGAFNLGMMSLALLTLPRATWKFLEE